MSFLAARAIFFYRNTIAQFIYELNAPASTIADSISELKGSQPLASRQSRVEFVTKVLPIERFNGPVPVLVDQVDSHRDEQVVALAVPQTTFHPAGFVVVTDRVRRKGRHERFRLAHE